jgi:hypothetical protein
MSEDLVPGLVETTGCPLAFLKKKKKKTLIAWGVLN